MLLPSPLSSMPSFGFLGVVCDLAQLYNDREPTQCVCVADCYFIVNVLVLPFTSPIAIYR